MLTEAIQTMYRYNAWANQHVLDGADYLTAGQLLASRDGGIGSIRDTLVHIMGAQELYLARWQGASPSRMLAPAQFPDLAAVRSRWADIEAETQAFVAGLDGDRLGRVVEYTNLEGEQWAYPLWQQMLQQVNHATQHRSEVALLLTQLGHSPGWLDFLYFIDLQNRSRTNN